MKKYSFAPIAFVALSVSCLPAFAGLSSEGIILKDTRSFSCQGKEGTMAFTWNESTATIQFSDISAFGSADMLSNVAFGATLNSGKTLRFEYNWYYTAGYELAFPSNPMTYHKGDQVSVQFSGDDEDGYLIDAAETCTVTADT